jgi:phage tail-like protein
MTQRNDALGKRRFSVEVDGVSVAGFRSVDLPRRSTELVDYEEGGDGAQRTVGGRTEYEDLTMERGVMKDDSTLWDWRKDIEQGKVDEGRKTVRVSLQDEEGTARMTWEFTNAWPRGYEPPELDTTADSDDVATESVTVVFDEMKRTK